MFTLGLILKILAIVLVVLTDFFLVYFGLKYVAVHGDPRQTEEAKIGLVFSFFANLASLVALILIGVAEGGYHWPLPFLHQCLLIAGCVGFVVASLFSALLFFLPPRFLKDAYTVLFFIGIFVCASSTQLLVILATF